VQSYLQQQRCSKKDRVFLPRVAESLTHRERWPRFRIICLLFTAALSISHSAGAQALYGLLTENVTDSSGDAVAGAKIIAANVRTNEVRQGKSNTEGGYSFTNLSAGEYTVTVTMSGFQSFQTTGVTVSIDSVVRLNAVLQIGRINEQITVTAAAAVLQTDRADLRYETNERELNNLPTPVGRNYQAELRVIPGFSVTGGGAVRGSNPAAAFTMNVNGAPAELNNVRIDGGYCGKQL